MRKIYLFLLLFNIAFGFHLDKQSLEEYSIQAEVDEPAEILNRYIEEAFGYTLEGKSSKKIYISLCKDICYDIDISEMSPEGFVIQNKGDDIFILSKSESGLIYGVYRFLEELGFRFFTPEFIHKPENFHFDFINIREEPSFRYREIFVKELDNPYWSEMFFLNGRTGHRIDRPLRYGNRYMLMLSLYDIVPDKEFHCGNQIDFTDQQAKEIAVENVRALLKRYKNKENLHLLISTNDINTYCKNKRSLERIKEGKAPSTPYLDFVSYIASSLKDEFPDVMFFALAYQWSRKPPKNYGKLPENMGILFSTSEADFSKPLLIRNNTDIVRDLLNWRKITGYIFVWHYITNFSNYLIPFPNIYQIADDIKYLSRISEVKGIFLQGAYNSKGSSLIELKSWLFAKLLWNANQDVDSLLSEFLRYYYKGAEKQVEEYIDKLYLYVKNPSVKLKIKTPPNFLDTDFVKELIEIIKEGKENTDFPETKEHLDHILATLYVYLLINGDSSLSEGEKSLIGKVLNKRDIRKFSESGDINDILLFINSETKEVYSERGEVEFQEFHLKLCCSDIVEDRYASNGIAVAVAGWRKDWAVQFDLDNLPEGYWDLYFRIRVQAKEDENPEGITAFRYGVYPFSDTKEEYLEDFFDGEYRNVYIGRYKKGKGTVWIAPPGNSHVEYILVDKIYAVPAD